MLDRDASDALAQEVFGDEDPLGLLDLHERTVYDVLDQQGWFDVYGIQDGVDVALVVVQALRDKGYLDKEHFVRPE